MQMRHARFLVAALLAASSAQGAKLPPCPAGDYFECAKGEFREQRYAEALLALRKIESAGVGQTRCAIALVLTLMGRFDEAEPYLTSCEGLPPDGFLDHIIANTDAYRPGDGGTVRMYPDDVRANIEIRGVDDAAVRLLELYFSKDPKRSGKIIFASGEGESVPPRAIWLGSGAWFARSVWQVGDGQQTRVSSRIEITPGGTVPSILIEAPPAPSVGGATGTVQIIDSGKVQPIAPARLFSLYARLDADLSEIKPRGGATVLGAALLLGDVFQPVVSVDASPRLLGGWVGVGAHLLPLGSSLRLGALAGAPIFLWNFGDDERLPNRIVGLHAAATLRWTPEFPQSFFVAAGVQHYPWLDDVTLAKTLFVLSIGADWGLL
jgi:hypothetical protein